MSVTTGLSAGGMPSTVGIVGLGLLGGSLALDLVETGVHVRGLDPDPATQARAAARGIEVVAHLDAVADAEVVVVATPTARVADTVRALVAAGPVPVTDLASVRTAAALGWGDEPMPPTWVGGHPMAGTERRGFGAAQRGLVVGASWLLTPHDGVDVVALATTVSLVLGLGARPVVLAPDLHDTVVATTSHLPHLVAWALQARAHDLGEGMLALAGPSFRDATRVAASDPSFWADLLDRNRVAVVAALDELQAWLADTADATRDDLVERLSAARRVPGPPPVGTRTTVVDLADLPTALARLRAAGAQGRAVVEVTSDAGATALVLSG